MSITLKLATVQDVQLLHEIGIKSYCHHFEHLWNNKTELNDYLFKEYTPSKITSDINLANTDWFLIQSPQSIAIGLVKLSYHLPIPESSAIGTLLNKVYFSPHSTGQGFGKAVFQIIEQLAMKQGDQWLWLDVLADNHQAIRFYQSNGMQKIKEIMFTSQTQQTLEYLMSKKL